MTDTVTISRELLERIIEEHAPPAITTALICLGMSAEWCELRAALAAPRQPDK